MDKLCSKSDKSRQGIALIVVVGMLALMMVMAVAFSIYMRTERVAAGSFKAEVRARNLLHVALNQAMTAIDSNMAASSAIYPPFEVLSTPGSNVVFAMTKTMLDQLPLAALTAQGSCLAGSANYLVIGASVVNRGAVINLTDHSFGIVTNVIGVGGGSYRVDHTVLSGGNVNSWRAGDKYYFLNPGFVELPASFGEGRYGYIVVNCSGLLDANQVGGLPRSVGTNAMEVQISSLPDGVITNLLVTQRQSANFETLQELVRRGRLQGAITNFPDHLVSYSSGVNDSRVYLGGTVAALVSNRAEIIGALTNLSCSEYPGSYANFTVAEAGVLFTNLVDFVDADYIPGNLGDITSAGNPSGPYVEKVPMANEIVVSNRVVYDLVVTNFPAVTNYVMSGANMVSVEFAMPVVGSEVIPNFRWDFSLQGVSGSPALNPAIGASYTNMLLSTAIVPLYPLNIRRVNLPMVGNPVAGPLFLAPLTNVYSAKIMTRYLANVVDAVTNFGVTQSVITVFSPAGGTISPGVYTQYVGAGVAIQECIDPRLNGIPGAWGYRTGMTDTLGSDNFLALLRLYPATYGTGLERTYSGPYLARSEGKDGDTEMYVANAPLNSVGDLGYIFFGNTVFHTWETVRLSRIGANGTYGKIHPVLNFFTLDNSAIGGIKGRINPNTRDVTVMNTVFSGMPLNRRHSRLPATPLSTAQSDVVVNAIMGKTATNGFESLAEFGIIRWDTLFPIPTLSSLDRESIIRNSCRLFNVRQNLFVILLYADVSKRDISGNFASLSTMLGVAEVWRDPVDSTNRYPSNIHLFQVMESP